MQETLPAAGEAIAEQTPDLTAEGEYTVNAEGVEELVADEGYHRTRRSLPCPAVGSAADRKDDPELRATHCDTRDPLVSAPACAFPSP